MSDADSHPPVDRAKYGIWLVAFGAALWGSDALFRLPLTEEVASTTIVFAEHVVLVLVTLPWLARALRSVRWLSARQLLALLFIGAGASALATTLFTLAFEYGGPITPIALQKVQPIIAAAAAAVLLAERLRPRYGVFLVIAIISAWLLAFADPVNVTISGLKAGLLAVGAAALWAGGTVAGRYISDALTPNDVTAFRFAIGLPTMFVLVLATDNELVPPADAWPTVVGLALVPGLIAVSVYYRGLRTTPAARATIAELAFPVTAAIVGVAVLDKTQTWSQWLGLALLMATVVGFAQHERRSSTTAVAAELVRT